MASFTIWNTLDDVISLEITHFGCIGIYNGVATVCCYYANLPIGHGGYASTTGNECVSTGDNYGLHVQVQENGGDKDYVANKDPHCPDSGNTDYHLKIEHGELHLEDGTGGADTTAGTAAPFQCVKKPGE